MRRKLFGTDGIRGPANQYPMTGEVAFLLGRVVSHFFESELLGKDTQPIIIVGKDTRLSCYMLEQAFTAGVCAQGGRAIMTGALPTPGVAFVTKSMRAQAGVVISASHNSYKDNGIKIFNSRGYKLPDSLELELEALVLNPSLIPIKTGSQLGRAERLQEVYGRYLVHAKNAFPDNFDMEHIRLVLDCSNGAAHRVGPIVFKELGAEVFSVGCSPNGTNINHQCGSMHPRAAVEMLKKYRADIGICLDGDGDRLVVIDEQGRVIEGDHLLALFVRLYFDLGYLKKGDTVVGTVMSNLGLEQYVQSLGLNFHRTQVGDRYMAEYMRKHNILLGGESSGHIIFFRHSTTGDGILAALKTIECMCYYKKPLSKLIDESISLYPQVLKSTVVGEKKPFEHIEPVQTSINRARKRLGTKGRVLVRYSGTEPVARVMVEGENSSLINELCEDLVKSVSRSLN